MTNFDYYPLFFSGAIEFAHAQSSVLSVYNFLDNITPRSMSDYFIGSCSLVADTLYNVAPNRLRLLTHAIPLHRRMVWRWKVTKCSILE